MQCADLCLCGGKEREDREERDRVKRSFGDFMWIDIHSIHPCVSKFGITYIRHKKKRL